MTPFAYSSRGILMAEGTALPDLAAEFGTPCYVYSASRIRENLATLHTALPGALICFAVKANSNQAVISLLARAGAGADIVSGGELARALAAGIPPQRIVFSGVGKSDDEIRAALTAGIGQLNVESIEEIERIARQATALHTPARLALRINPDVAAATHDKISTGRKGDKFGIDHEQLMAAANCVRRHPGLTLIGLDVHIGSQLFDLEDFRQAYSVAATYVRDLRAQGFALSRLDLGGGLGVPYRGEAPFDVTGFARMINETVGALNCELILEPGRYLVADAGVLLSRVIALKQGVNGSFVILDAAMNDLIRPALYEAWHGIRPVCAPAPDAPLQPVDVVGPVCESSDCFASARKLPPLTAGDLVVLDTAGAYGAVMAGTYNTRPLCPEVMVEGQRRALVRPRLDIAAQISRDQVPDWLKS